MAHQAEPKEGGPPTHSLLMRGAGTSNLKDAITMDLHNVGIDAIENLELCPKLRSLDMSFNKIKEMKNLESMTELRELKLYDNRILYVKNLLQLTALQSLDLSGNRVENIEGISHLKQLTALRLRHNKITELTGFGKMSGLELLDVSHNKIQEIEGLQGCTALKELVLHGNKIATVSGLSRLSRLTELGLNGNKLASLHGVKEVASSLDILWVAENQLESLRGIPDCLPRLSELYISDNKLTTLQPLDKCCPSLELLDASRNKLASVKRLQAALSPLDDLAELKAEGNPICHQPEGQPPYRERMVASLLRLRYLDEEEITEVERAWAANGGALAAAAAAGADPEHMPTVEEMEEFKRRMGIRSDVPTMGSPGSSRPSSAGTSGRPSSAALRRSMSGTARPSTPSEALPHGTAPVGPLGRPSTPRSKGQVVLDARAIGNPVMTQRPPSARTGQQGGPAVMRPEQYEASLVDFTNTMNQYQMQMQEIMRKMREGLAMDLPQATAAVRANGMRGPEDTVTSALPRLPQLPTFATKSDTDAALKKEARMQAAAKQPSASPSKLAAASGGTSTGGSAPATPEKRHRGRAAPQPLVPTPTGPPPGASAPAAPPPSIPGVRDSVAAMPNKANELLEYYNKLFPSESPPGDDEDVEQQQQQRQGQRQGPQDSGLPPAPTPSAHPPAAVSAAWTGPGGAPGYAAAGGFKRVDMDSLDSLDASSSSTAPATATTSKAPQKFARVDMDDDDLGGVYSTATAATRAPPQVDRRPREPEQDAPREPTQADPEPPVSSNSGSLMSKLEALEQMVSDYGSAAAQDGAADALSLAAADEALYKDLQMQQLEEQTKMILGEAGAPPVGTLEGSNGIGSAAAHHRDVTGSYGDGDSDEDNDDIVFRDVSAPAAAKYSSFKLPASSSSKAMRPEVSSPGSSRPSSRGSIGGRLGGSRTGASNGQGDEAATAAGKKTRPISATQKQKLCRRAPGGVLSKKS